MLYTVLIINILIKIYFIEDKTQKGVDNPVFKVEASDDEVVIKKKRGIANNAYVVNT